MRKIIAGHSKKLQHGRIQQKDSNLQASWSLSLAGAEGLEPSTNGFGDRDSTS